MDFAERYGPWAVVLGASEGLGAAYADGLAGRGCNVVVAARRSGPLQAVADGVARQHGVDVRAVTLDLATDDFLDVLCDVTDPLDVGLVIYNATADFLGEFLDEGADHMRLQLDVNCRGPLLVADRFGRHMVDRGSGGMVIMGSGAGLAGTARNATYAATKAFDLVLGESLWAEWKPKGVDVLSVIAPAMDTPNFRRQFPYDPPSLPEPPVKPQQVVDEVLAQLGEQPCFVPGEKFREGLAILMTLPREQQVELLSQAQADVYLEA